MKLEDRRPGLEVLLTFLAPPEVLRRFKADLGNQGLTFQEELLLPGILSSCRLLAGKPIFKKTLIFNYCT